MTTISHERRKVFISYVKDNSEVVQQICAILKKNGIKYWIDHNHIEPGKMWKQAIKDAINGGALFLACFSKEYEERSTTYMNEELLVAVEILRTKRYDSGWLIPIKLSRCKIPPLDIGASRTLQDLQYLSFYEDWDTSVNRLIDVIRKEESPKQSEKEKGFSEKAYVYQGLKSWIESGSGQGFHNADLGHPVYCIGASEATKEMLKDWEYADSPEKNLLFKMLSNLSKELKELGIEDCHYVWWYDFSEWRDFCRFAIGVYDSRLSSIR